MLRRSTSLAAIAASVLLVAAFESPGSRAGDTPAVSSYDLEISLLPGEARLEGDATITFAPHPPPIENLVFHLHGELRVESVESPEGALRFTQKAVFYRSDYSLVATRVTLDLEGAEMPESLTIRYAGFFHPSSARSPSDYMRIDATGTYLRSYGYSLWFPVFLGESMDAPAASFPSVRISTPPGFLPVFVGQRVSEQVVEGRRLSEWRAMDISLFGAQLTARPYELVRIGDMHVYFTRNETDRKAAGEIGRLTSRLVERFRQDYRPDAPSRQFHIAQLPKFGDISSGNMVGISDETWREFGRTEWAVRTLAHEIVHPFVQVATPLGSPLRALVIEGFPSYFHLPALAALRGEPFYEDYLNRVQRSYLEKRATGKDRRNRPLPPEKPLVEIDEGEIRVYKDRFVLADRALLFLDHLRRSMGPGEFLAFARELFRREKISLEELYAAVEARLEGGEATARIWLETSDYPERLRRPR